MGTRLRAGSNGVAASVKIVDLYPERGDGSDVSDWLQTDTAGVKLMKAVNDTPVWEPSADDAEDETGEVKTDVEGDDELIAELATLSRLQYAKRRAKTAKQLEITAGELDKIVAEARGAEALSSSAGLYPHWNVDPSEEPVQGQALLQSLMDTLRKYVVMTSEQTLVVALWIVLSWLHERVAVHSPILLATSPLPDSGKTTLLKLVCFLVRNGLSSVSITGPALFRSIDKWAPTFALDDADLAFVRNDDLTEVVNSGWTRGDGIIRCDPLTHDPRLFSTFCPKAIGMIGRKLQPATMSRCLMIAMRRKRPEEETEDFPHADNEHFARLRSQLLRWATDNADALIHAKPEVPPGLYNRTRMNWRLLLAIAEQCGWKKAAWKAVHSIEEVRASADPQLGVRIHRHPCHLRSAQR